MRSTSTDDTTPTRGNLTLNPAIGIDRPSRSRHDPDSTSVSSAFNYKILRSPDTSDHEAPSDIDGTNDDPNGESGDDPDTIDPSELVEDPNDPDDPNVTSGDDTPRSSDSDDDTSPAGSEAYRLLHFVGFALDSPLIRLVLDDAGIITTHDLLDFCTKMPITIYQTFRNTSHIKEISVVFDRHEAGVQLTLFMILFRAIVIGIIGYQLIDGRFDSFLNLDDLTFQGQFTSDHRRDITRNIPHVRKYVERDLAAALSRTNHHAVKPSPLQSRGTSAATNAALNRISISQAVRHTTDLLAATGLANATHSVALDDIADDLSTTSAQAKRAQLLRHNTPTHANTSRRSHLPASIRWNGREDTFPAYEIAMNAWLLQSFMGYMVNTRFLDAYRQGGWDEAQTHATDVTFAQFKVDNQCLCGALLASTQGRGQRHILDAQAASDGMKAWTTFLDIYGGRNNLSLRIQRLDAKLQIP